MEQIGNELIAKWQASLINIYFIDYNAKKNTIKNILEEIAKYNDDLSISNLKDIANGMLLISNLLLAISNNNIVFTPTELSASAVKILSELIKS